MINDKITALQQGLEGTDAFVAGEQLKEICKDPACAELVEKNLEGKGMGLKECAAKIKAYADKHKDKSGRFAFVPPDVAEGIIREFYGLPARAAAKPEEKAEREPGGIINLEDFL